MLDIYLGNLASKTCFSPQRWWNHRRADFLIRQIINVMIKGFEIFRTRNSYLLSEINIYPPFYNKFYSTFEIGQGKLYSPSVYLDQIKQIAGIVDQKIDLEVDFVINDFLSFEESKIFLQNSYEADDEIHGKFYPIAECDSNKAILIGIDKSNSDQVFIENTNLFSDGSRFKYLASNIFEFITKISFVEMEQIGYGINSYNNLYKEWNEKFWRVKK